MYKKDNNTIYIYIYSKDYELINSIKTIYEINILSKHGILSFVNWLKKNIMLFIFLIIGIFVLSFLSNVIFDIEVIHTDKNLRNLIINQLEEYGVKKYSLKKDFNSIKKIKEKILFNNKDKIEWMEVVEYGTKYIVRVEERIISNDLEECIPRDIVAKKNSTIMLIDVSKGEIVKRKLDYVHPGDVIVSGKVHLNDEVKNYVCASGSVYGETWYKVSIEYPMHYEETLYTNNKKKVLGLHFFDKAYYLFDFKKYKDYEISNNKIIFDNLFPIYLSIDLKREVIKTNENYTIDRATELAIEKIKEKINSKLNENEHIIDIKKLKVEENNSTIILDVFVTVYENITEYNVINIEEDDL